jgi:hypothetical protein
MLDGGLVVADGEYDHLMQASPVFRRLAGIGSSEG